MNGSVSDLAVGLDGSLYAVGYFTGAGTVYSPYVARWNGTAWYPLGNGVGEEAYAVAVGPDGSVYVGGYWFGITRWDPQTASWYPVGSGIPGGNETSIWGLAFGPNGSLYAGGYFEIVGGVEANNIARWDGSEWHSLGSGMDGLVSTFAFTPDGSLYAGGGFNTAGGIPSSRIARWTDVSPTVVALSSMQAESGHRPTASFWLVTAMLGLALTAGATLTHRQPRTRSSQRSRRRRLDRGWRED